MKKQIVFISFFIFLSTFLTSCIPFDKLENLAEEMESIKEELNSTINSLKDKDNEIEYSIDGDDKTNKDSENDKFITANSESITKEDLIGTWEVTPKGSVFVFNEDNTVSWFKDNEMSEDNVQSGTYKLVDDKPYFINEKTNEEISKSATIEIDITNLVMNGQSSTAPGKTPLYILEFNKSKNILLIQNLNTANQYSIQKIN